MDCCPVWCTWWVGYPSFSLYSGAVNTKATSAVSVLTLLTVDYWSLISGIASSPLPVDDFLRVYPSVLMPSSLWVPVTCSPCYQQPACLSGLRFVGPYRGHTCCIAFWDDIITILDDIISEAYAWLIEGFGETLLRHGMTSCLGVMIGWLKVWLWLGNYLFVVQDKLIAIIMSDQLVVGLCPVVPINHRAMFCMTY